MAFTDPISVDELRTNFDAKTATITANKKLGKKDCEPSLRLASLASTADILRRSRAWVPQVDSELRTIFIRVTDTTANRTVTARLTVDDPLGVGVSRALLDLDLSVTITTINGTVQASTDFRTTTGKRVRVPAGVRVRLEIENETGGTTINGPLEAGVQLRPTRRGGSGGPAYVPHSFRSGGNVDVDKLNANLRQIAADIRASQDSRYTYASMFFDLGGITDTDVAALRSFAIRRPGANNGIEIVGVEMVLPVATEGTTWTAAIAALPLWPPLEVLAAGTLTEDDSSVYAVHNAPVAITSSAADVVIELTPDTATGVNTITEGYLVVHTRADRWNQGSALTRYTPTPYDATTSRAAATLQAEIDAIAARVAEDTAADVDLRAECFVVRGLASGSSRTFRLPSGAREILATVAYIVAGAGTTATWTVVGTNLAGASNAVVGTGAGNRVAGTDAAAGVMEDDPTDSADDATVTCAITGGGTATLTYCFVFWQ